jgi:hypothetical protein
VNVEDRDHAVLDRLASEALADLLGDLFGPGHELSKLDGGAYLRARRLLLLLAELIEPAAAAAQEWLEARDDEDREATVDARHQLLAALDESPELATVTSRLHRLLASGRPASTDLSHPAPLRLTPTSTWTRCLKSFSGASS